MENIRWYSESSNFGLIKIEPTEEQKKELTELFFCGKDENCQFENGVYLEVCKCHPENKGKLIEIVDGSIYE